MPFLTLLGKVNNDMNSGKECFLEVIPLIKDKTIDTPRDQRIVIKLGSNPTDNKSPHYGIVTQVFDYSSPEEWICHKKFIAKIFTGHNITRGPNKFQRVRRLLAGKVIADFEATIITKSYVETTAE